VIPELQVMKVDNFHATESVTGDSYYGVMFDNTASYSVGSTQTSGTDDAGGHWTYTIDSVGTADSAHQNAFYSGKVYDYFYSDVDLGTSAYPYYGFTGFAGGTAQDTTFFSGSSYLGSDGDVVTFQGGSYSIGSGHYVVPDPLPSHEIPALAAVPATLAATVDSSAISGSDGAASANLALIGNYGAAAFATPTGALATTVADSSLTSPIVLAAQS
jgi:hypothetical protein